MDPFLPIPTGIRIALVFAAISASAPLHAMDRVWAPLFDQAAQRELENRGANLLGHPDFPAGQDRKTTRMNMARALEIAKGKGIRIIDLQFFLARDQLEPAYARAYPVDSAGSSGPSSRRPPVWDASLIGFADCSQDWLEAVGAFNRSHPGQEFGLRLRIPGQASLLYYILRTLKPYAAGMAEEDWTAGKLRSHFPDMPLDPCFEKSDAEDPCFANSPVPAGYYRSRSDRGGMSNTVANLANPAVRRAIGRYAAIAIAEAGFITGPGTRIEEASLALDAGWETGLFLDDAGGVASFNGAPFMPDSSISWKIRFYRLREASLKAVIRAFADSVHARRNPDGTPIAAGIFQQAHQLDGRSRGTFDLYELLKGSGLDVLHHTQPPADYATSLEWTAFSAGVANSLGIGFDTEFSWAHFGGPELVRWRPDLLTPGNARKFLDQARAGGNYGAGAVVFCNWTMHDICFPPHQALWQSLIGASDGSPASERAPSGEGFGRIKPYPGRNRPAIYISTFGRLECEEVAASGLSPSRGCDASTYMKWFREFGLIGMLPRTGPLFRDRVEILTDGMIRDNAVQWDSLSRIYLPYQPSNLVDKTVMQRLSSLPDGIKGRFRWQSSQGGPAKAGFSEWKVKVRLVAGGPLAEHNGE